eukprot:COSAG01_NODE_4520_length_4959_cov_4.342181_3_plen_90_part_00
MDHRISAKLSTAGEFEEQLGVVQEQLIAEQRMTATLQEDLEAEAEKIRPLQRQIEQKEKALKVEKAKASDAQGQLKIHIDSMEVMTKVR